MIGASPLSMLKLALAAAGVALFGAGIRFDEPRLRWAGLALVAVAWLLRFSGPRSSRRGPRFAPPQSPDETR